MSSPSPPLKSHPPFDPARARDQLEASLPLMLECPAAAWALMSSSWAREAQQGLDPGSPGGLAEFRARYFLQEKAALFAAADARAGVWASERPGMLRRLAKADRADLLEPYLRAYPERARQEAFASQGEELLSECERGEPRLRCLRLWSDLKMIAGTAKRANQALSCGQAEVSAAIKKPTLSSFRDYVQEHPTRWGEAAARFFEPVVAAALAKFKPGSPQQRALEEAFAPKSAVMIELSLKRLAAQHGPEHSSASALRAYYEWMPEFMYALWAKASPFPALVFLERSGQSEALERLARQPGVQALLEGERLPLKALSAVASPESALMRGVAGEAFARSLAMGAPPAPEPTLAEASLLARCPAALKAALSAGQALPSMERLRQLAEGCPSHFFGYERDGEGVEEALRQAGALRESSELEGLLPSGAPRRRGPL